MPAFHDKVTHVALVGGSSAEARAPLARAREDGLTPVPGSPEEKTTSHWQCCWQGSFPGDAVLLLPEKLVLLRLDSEQAAYARLFLERPVVNKESVYLPRQLFESLLNRRLRK